MIGNRYICDVLEEMRKTYETRNFAYLLGLIEEAQTMANRMEDKINTISDYEGLRKDIKQLREKYNELVNKNAESIN